MVPREDSPDESKLYVAIISAHAHKHAAASRVLMPCPYITNSSLSGLTMSNIFTSIALLEVHPEVDHHPLVITFPLTPHGTPPPPSPPPPATVETDTSHDVPLQPERAQYAHDPAPIANPPIRLTMHILAMHDRTFDRLLNTAQAFVKALDVQNAAKDLNIELPLQCYMSDRHELVGWVRQQSK
jgi:hypothetical protein